jgi:DHA1 family tetracycline resistance protein-like MFS transporter
VLEYLVISLVTAFVPERESAQFGAQEYMIVGVASGISGVLSLFGTPTIGRLSDAVGRRNLMLLTVVVTALPACSLLFIENMLIYEGLRAASGLLTATFSLAFAMAADVTTVEQRGAAIGQIVASFGVAFSIGPLVATVMDGWTGMLGPHILAIVLTVVNIAYIWFLLPETLPQRKHSPSVCSHLRSPFETVVPMLAHPTLRLLAAIVFFVNISEMGLISLIISFLQRHLGFTPMDIAIFAVVLGVAMAASQAFMLPCLLRRFQGRTIILVATVVNAIHTAAYGLLTAKWQAFLILMLTTVAFLGFAAATHLVSRMVPPTRQGQFQGALTGIRALTNGIGPTLFGPLLAATCTSAATAAGPPPYTVDCGITFFVGAGLVLVAAVLAMFLPDESTVDAVREQVRVAARDAEQARAKTTDDVQRRLSWLSVESAAVAASEVVPGTESLLSDDHLTA